VLSVRDTIYLMPSTTSPLPIHDADAAIDRTRRVLQPAHAVAAHGARKRAKGCFAKPDSVQPGPWDPQFFFDADTNRWFMYWNSSNVYPLNVIELIKRNSSRTRARHAGCSV
jgi:hypothetical protein